MKGKKDIVRVSATTHLQEFLWARPIHPYSLLPSWGVGVRNKGVVPRHVQEVPYPLITIKPLKM